MGPTDQAVDSIDMPEATIVLSHGWLEANHPDRLAMRRDDIARMLSLNVNTILAFMDFLTPPRG